MKHEDDKVRAAAIAARFPSERDCPFCNGSGFELRTPTSTPHAYLCRCCEGHRRVSVKIVPFGSGQMGVTFEPIPKHQESSAIELQ